MGKATNSKGGLNMQYKILLQPLEKHPVKGKKFWIGVYKLPEYIGDHNAQTILKKAQNLGVNKKMFSRESFGRIWIYLK